MATDNHFNANWYDLWMKQSKEFFETADQNLKEMFSKDSPVNPEDHLKQIHAWLETLKEQWEFTQLTEEQKAYQAYWKMMSKMCSDASDLMLEEWIKRSKEHQPIHNVHELYELWLDCCHRIYQKYLQTDAYQKAYGEFMNSAMKFWGEAISKSFHK